MKWHQIYSLYVFLQVTLELTFKIPFLLPWVHNFSFFFYFDTLEVSWQCSGRKYVAYPYYLTGLVSGLVHCHQHHIHLQYTHIQSQSTCEIYPSKLGFPIFVKVFSRNFVSINEINSSIFCETKPGKIIINKET